MSKSSLRKTLAQKVIGTVLFSLFLALNLMVWDHAVAQIRLCVHVDEEDVLPMPEMLGNSPMIMVSVLFPTPPFKLMMLTVDCCHE